MTATCELPQSQRESDRGWPTWFDGLLGPHEQLHMDAAGVGVDPVVPFFCASAEAMVREHVRLWAELLRSTTDCLFGVTGYPLKSFVDEVSLIPEVTDVVFFTDDEGDHLWTLMARRSYEAETLVLDAQLVLEDQWTQDDLDSFMLVGERDEFEARLPAAFARIYSTSMAYQAAIEGK